MKLDEAERSKEGMTWGDLYLMVTPTSPTDPCHQHNHAQEGQNILSTSSVEYLEHFRQHDQEKKQNQNEKYSIKHIFAA